MVWVMTLTGRDPTLWMSSMTMISTPNTGTRTTPIPISITLLSSAQRLGQLQSDSKSKSFSDVIEISRPDFLTQVTEASHQSFVLLHLYQSSLESCQLLSKSLRSFALKYPRVKFVEIVSTRCIEKYPDALLPTVLVYKDGNVYSQTSMVTPEQLKVTLEVIQKHLDEQEESE